MNSDQDKLAFLKTAIAATARALSKQPLQVDFGGQRPSAELTITLPALSEPPSPAHLSYVRGAADHAALSLRHHNPELHRSLRPAGRANAALFDMLESVRVETLGSENMAGIIANLYGRFEQECLRRGLQKATLPPLVMVELYARRHIQNLPAPAFLASIFDHASKEMTALQPMFTQMRQHIGDQKHYAAISIEIIKKLAHITASLEPGDRTNDTPAPEKSEESADRDQPVEKHEPNTLSKEEMLQLFQNTITLGLAPSEDQQARDGKDAAMKESPYPFNQEMPAQDGRAYHAYTQKFDETVPAGSLSTPSEMDYLAKQLDGKLSQFQSITARLASRLQHLLLARQARRWIFDEEDGIIDSRKLSRLVVHPDYQQIYKREKDTEFRDTVVSLLIDNSGSMRGRPITMAALSADILSRTLERCGVKVEILGFTTREWKGGSTYKQWLKDGKPSHPGRLNDLRHIIYKSAEMNWRKARRNLGLMLKDGILKENIDGEAIQWACDRLLKRPEQRRILMVISDGAPVDDSTLSANGGNYLDRHLREVIAHVENHTPIELLAIGIGHDVTRYYRRAVTISDIDKLGETMTEQLAALFSEPKDKKKVKRPFLRRASS